MVSTGGTVSSGGSKRSSCAGAADSAGSAAERVVRLITTDDRRDVDGQPLVLGQQSRIGELGSESGPVDDVKQAEAALRRALRRLARRHMVREGEE